MSGALILGTLVGVALIVVSVASTRGPLIYIPYSALLAALAALLVRNRAATFRARFAASLAGFMLATLFLYRYIVLIGSPSASSISLWGHAWRLGFAGGVGAILAAVISYATHWINRHASRATPSSGGLTG